MVSRLKSAVETNGTKAVIALHVPERPAWNGSDLTQKRRWNVSEDFTETIQIRTVNTDGDGERTTDEQRPQGRVVTEQRSLLPVVLTQPPSGMHLSIITVTSAFVAVVLTRN